MSVDPEELRAAMRQWTTGVTVVTTEHNGVRHGMTVNSFTSISLQPPLVLVSLERTTRTHNLVAAAGTFGVTILPEHMREVSDCFAGRHNDQEDRFFGLSTRILKTGAAFIEGGLAFIDCQVVSTYEAGTHTLFIGEVVAVESPGGGSPLAYYNRQYRGLTHES